MMGILILLVPVLGLFNVGVSGAEIGISWLSDTEIPQLCIFNSFSRRNSVYYGKPVYSFR